MTLKIIIPSLGENIKNRRKLLGMSQTDLAKRVSLSGPAIISQYESNAVMPTASTFAKMAKVLGVTMHELYYGKDYKANEVSDEEYKNIITLAHTFPENARPIIREIIRTIDLYLKSCNLNNKITKAESSKTK